MRCHNEFMLVVLSEFVITFGIIRKLSSSHLADNKNGKHESKYSLSEGFPSSANASRIAWLQTFVMLKSVDRHDIQAITSKSWFESKYNRFCSVKQFARQSNSSNHRKENRNTMRNWINQELKHNFLIRILYVHIQLSLSARIISPIFYLWLVFYT